MNPLQGTFAALLVAGLLMSGAAGGADKLEADRLEIVALPGRTDVDARDVAADVTLAILAVSQTLRGDGDLSRGLAKTRLAPGARVVSYDGRPKGDGFRYDGFRLGRVTLNVVEPSRHADPGRRLTGVLQFANIEGLRAQAAFMVDYGYAAAGVVVHELQAMPMTPVDVRVILRAVPLKAGQALLEQRPATLEDLLEYTASHDQPMPLPAGEWMLVAVSPDRVLPGDRLEIQVGSPGGGPVGSQAGNQAGPVTTLAYWDFPVAAVPWTGSGKPAVASVFLRTGLHPDGSDGRRLLGTLALGERRKP